MVITYHGENYVKVSSGTFTFLVDPSDERSFRGAKFAVYTETPETDGREGASADALARRDPLVISRPGEYEIEGVRIAGYRGKQPGSAIYQITIENVALGFLGHLVEPPDQSVMEALADLDVLFIPGGGKPWIREADAAKLVRQLEPGIVIPTLAAKHDCEGFVKELDTKLLPRAEKLTIKKKDITPKAMAVALLTP